MTHINLNQLANIFPKTKVPILEPYLEPLNKTFDKFGINTPLAQAAFLAQVGHESAGFNAVKENLNYSQKGLLKVFRKYFNAASAKAYARKPEKIANRVYANRMNNGPESSGDGWKYRGRGLLQITGKYNYTQLACYLGKTVDETVKYLETPEGAAIAAGWFFHQNKLIGLLKVGSVTKVTKRVNGGYHGLQDRKNIYFRARKYLG